MSEVRRITINRDYYELDRPMGVLRVKEYRSPDHEEVIRGATQLEDALEATNAELLEALEAVIKDLEERARYRYESGEYPKVVLAVGNGVLCKADRAIAKARGSNE